MPRVCRKAKVGPKGTHIYTGFFSPFWRSWLNDGHLKNKRAHWSFTYILIKIMTILQLKITQRGFCHTWKLSSLCGMKRKRWALGFFPWWAKKNQVSRNTESRLSEKNHMVATLHLMGLESQLWSGKLTKDSQVPSVRVSIFLHQVFPSYQNESLWPKCFWLVCPFAIKLFLHIFGKLAHAQILPIKSNTICKNKFCIWKSRMWVLVCFAREKSFWRLRGEKKFPKDDVHNENGLFTFLLGLNPASFQNNWTQTLKGLV